MAAAQGGFISSYIDLSPSSSRELHSAGASADGDADSLYTAASSGASLQHEHDAGGKGHAPYTDSLGANLKPERAGQEDNCAAESDDEDDEDSIPFVYASYSTTCLLNESGNRPNKKHAGKVDAKRRRQEDSDDDETSSCYAEVSLGDEDSKAASSTYSSISRYSSTLASPRSMDELPTAKGLTGYSTPVLHKDATRAYEDAYVTVGSLRKEGSADGDYFPVLTQDEKKKTNNTKFDLYTSGEMKAKLAYFEDQIDKQSLDEELMVRQKVAALLASLPSAKSRQRVVTQLQKGTNAAEGEDFEVLKPVAQVQKQLEVEPIKQEKEWAKMGEGRQWNEEYQRTVGKGLKQLVAEDVRAISRLSHDFVKQAEIYGKVIINELNVPDEWKTIKPANVGGVAGGAKYIVQGILYKFCLDPIVSKKPLVWLYGGERPDDDNAMKAAGLELQGLGLIATSQMTQLHVPLMALIDYKGFRLIATSLLPIGPDTLKYGSNDAGRTIKTGDQVMDHLMHGLGEHLNLRKHLVGKQRVPIVGPGDIEGHLGTDGRYYLLDFARLMPPETPLPDEDGHIDGRGVFFRMLRPELVRSFRVPLSSDTFTGWGMYDENRVAYELDVREATDLMINERVPAVAAEISQLYEVETGNCVDFTPAHLQQILEQLNLVARMHARGVNLRHLGRIRDKMTSSKGRKLLLSLALSRAFKSRLRRQMRKSVQKQTHAGASSESACKDVVVEFFNTVLGHTSKSHNFWRVGIKETLKSKFPFILTEAESDEDYNLLDAGCIKLTIMLCFKLGLVRFPTAVTEAIFKDYTAVRLLETDILDIPAIIKHNQLQHIFNGNICMFEAAKGQHNSSDALRLLRQAREHLMTAASMTPSCPYTNWVLGSIEIDIASRLLFDQESERLFTSAYERFARSCELDKTNAGPIGSWADALDQHAARLAANDADPARVAEMRALAGVKRQLAASKRVSTCSLITSPRH